MAFFALMRFPVRFVNYLLSPTRFMISRRGADVDEDLRSYMTTPAYARRLREELADVGHRFICGHFSHLHGEPPLERIRETVDEFFEVNARRPIRLNLGGSRFHNCFWLFVTLRYLKPTLIVESGVWKGLGTWYMRQACPEAELHALDISFDALEYRDSMGHYHETDWSNVDIRASDPERSVCFFDDHQNQPLRVHQAYERGFRILFFDDTIPGHKLYTDGWPPMPTIDMMMDDRVRPGDVIECRADGRKRSYRYTEEDCHNARGLIGTYAMFPDVASPTKYAQHSFLSLVTLKD
jgi:hypothetical protein